MESVRKALWLLESRFRGGVSPDELSMVAGISRHHFAHVFAGATGQSAMRYLRGRRLSEAARVLANGGPDILTVALDFGYGSHEAFTRAFRDQFAVTPNRFARNAISITSIWWRQSNLITPAGLGREINSGFIEGFIAETRARKLKAVLQTLVADPSLITADMVDEVLKFKRLDGSEAALRRIADANFAGGAQSALFSGKLRDNRPSKATPPAATAEKDQGQPLDDAELVKHPKVGQISRRAGVHVANVG